MNHSFRLIIITLLLTAAACQESTPEARLEKDSWNWGFNIVNEQEKVVLMTDMLKVGNYPAAVVNLQWLVKENPKLHPSIYEDGLLIYQGLIGESEDVATRLRWEKEKAALSRLKAKYFPGASADQ